MKNKSRATFSGNPAVSGRSVAFRPCLATGLAFSDKPETKTSTRLFDVNIVSQFDLCIQNQKEKSNQGKPDFWMRKS